MDRDKFTISVVPDSVNRTSSGPQIVPDPSAEWDAKWLHPKLTTLQPTEQSNRPSSAQPIEHSKRPSPPRQIEFSKRPSPPAEAEPEEREPDPLALRFLRWLFPDVNQRRAKRFPTPGLVAYYWTGGEPYSYHVGDMSATGLFLLTKERWAPGTLIQMTLQQQDGRIMNADSSISVLSEVVRWGENGAGFNFILSDYENVSDYGFGPGETIDRKSVERFLQRIGIPLSR
jgi:hypothetical protein